MLNKNTEGFERARKHAAAAREEFEAMCRILLPKPFWQHTQAAKKEGKAAVKLLLRAVKQRCRCGSIRQQVKQRIEIA